MPTVLDATVVNQAYDTSGNGGRKLVRLSNGWLVAGVYDSGTTSIRIYYSVDNGSSWASLKKISIGSGVNGFAIQNLNNRVFLLFSTNGGSVVCQSFDASQGSGASITQTTVDSSQTATGQVSLAINEAGTELHAAWSSKNSTYPNSFNIRYAKGTINADGSVTWGAVQQVTTNNSPSINTQNPCIIIYNNNPIIFADYKDTGGSWAGIRCLKYNGTWDTIGYVYYTSGYSHTQSSPSACVAPNGRIWVAWQGKDITDSAVDNVRVSYSDDGGVTWSSMQKLTSGNTNYQGAVSITVNKNNKVFILFADGTGGTGYDISVISNDGTGWGTKSTIASGTGNQQAPSALYDLTLDFTSPLFIYQNVGSSKVGFYGTWVVTTISVTPGYIGQKTSADKSNILTYSITTDGTMSDITEKINGVTIATRTNPTSGQEFTVSLTQEQWDAIKYGNGHTLTIEMGSYTWTYTFDKRLHANDDILSAVKGVQDLQDHLNGIKAQLAEAIRAKGGTVNDTDAWSAFVSAVSNMANKRWATGTKSWQTSSSEISSYTITGLQFQPSIIVVIRDTPPHSSTWRGIGLRIGSTFVGCPTSGTGVGGQACVCGITINNTSFQVDIVGSSGYTLSGVFTWYAFE